MMGVAHVDSLKLFWCYLDSGLAMWSAKWAAKWPAKWSAIYIAMLIVRKCLGECQRDCISEVAEKTGTARTTIMRLV